MTRTMYNDNHSAMRNFSGGVDTPHRYENPLLAEVEFSPEAGFADSNGIDKMSDWDEWDE